MRLTHFIAMLYILSSCSACFAIKPSNPKSSQDTRKVLNYIASLKTRKDKRVISGQYFGQPGNPGAYDAYVVKLHEKTNRWVALVGADYSFPDYPDPKIIASMNATLIQYWKDGGLVTVSSHIGNPWGGNAYERKVGDFDELLKPGTSAYDRWMKYWKNIGDGLTELRDNGVVVLFRPMHEMNGGWFWWPNKPEPFKKLWNFVYDYLTKTRSLNNLIWVFAPNVGYNPTTFYPGADRCDIVGLDYYGRDFNVTDYASMVALGKPFGFTEWGVDAQGKGADGSYDNTRLINAIRHKMPDITFFQVWSSWRNANIAIVDNQKATELLNDPWIINREDVNWKRSPAR